MKHIKAYENNKPTQIYYIIPMENIKEQLINFNCPKDIMKKILDNNDIYNNKYIYISWNEYDWDYTKFQEENYHTGTPEDGEEAYLEDTNTNYVFYGYNNLTEHQKQEVLKFKEKFIIQKNVNKYNL